jgi:hypothetical protein
MSGEQSGKRDRADDVVQALVVARGNLELGRLECATEALDRALLLARDLLGELAQGATPRRSSASGE